MDNVNHSATISVDSHRVIKTVFLFWVAVEVSMVIGDYLFNYSNIVSQPSLDSFFNITREDSLPSFAGVLQSILIAVTLWAIVTVVKRKRMPKFTVIGWTIVASFFTYMAIDDGSKLHETIGSLVYDLNADSVDTAGSVLVGFPSYIWQIVFLPAFAAMGLFVFVFLVRHLNSRRQKVVVFLALALLAAAVLLDFVEGLSENHPANIYAIITAKYDMAIYTAMHFGETPFDTLVHFSKSLEETIEMFAMTLFWTVFLSYLFQLGRVEIVVKPRDLSDIPDSSKTDEPVQS